MNRQRLIQFAALLVMAGLVASAASRMPAVNKGREALNIMGHESPLENTPPEYVFYIQALGAFRGLVADLAFIRADQLKRQGRFYDAMQLHKWICALQPHFPTVWEYASWNMAWNISVTTFTPEERWNWVYNGVKLLRDQGIPLNPRAINLYKQLAWIYCNKMSEPTDEQHKAYKINWAWRMHLILGPPPDPLRGLDPGQLAELADQITSSADIDMLEQVARGTHAAYEEQRRRTAARRGDEFKPRELVDPNELPAPSADESSAFRLAQRAAAEQIRVIRDAPTTVAELCARFPAAREMISALRGLGVDINDQPLNEDSYWRDEGLAFAFFQPYRALVSPESTLAQITRERPTDDAQQARLDRFAQILGVREQNPAGDALVRFLQRKVLSEVYKLDPAEMLKLIEQFGPLDWRSVDAQSLYWVARGLIAVGETIGTFESDKTNTARLIFFSLRNLLLRGNIIFEPQPAAINDSYINLSRNLNFVEPMHQAFLKYGPLFDPGVGGPQGAGEVYRGGHINFLTEAIRLLYLSGRKDEAARYYQQLRVLYPTTLTGEPNPALAKNLHDFVMDSFLESTVKMPALRDILILIDAWLYDGYNQLAEGHTEAYHTLVRAAREYHEKYMEDKRNDALWLSSRIPEFDALQIDAFGTFLTLPATTSSVTLRKAYLWRNAPLYLRQAVYDEILPRLTSECDFWNFDVSRAFPEPKGMDEYRAQHPRAPEPPPKEDDVKTLPRGG